MPDLDQIVNGVEPVEPEAAEPVVEVEAAPEPDVAEEPKTEPEAKPETTVPLAALLDVRKELQELKSLATPKPEPVAAPDVFEDPKGYSAHMQSQIQQVTNNARLDFSEDMARTTHGDAVVDAAFEAFKAKSDPATQQAIMATRSPWNEVVKWHQQQTIADEIGNDPTAYRAKIEAEVREKVEAEMVAKQAKDKAGQLAPSLADVTGTGGGPKSNWTGPTSISSVLPE